MSLLASVTVSASVDILDPERPKRIVIVASNLAVSEQTGWPIGFMRLVEQTRPLADVRVDDYDGLLLVGGQGPMYTFFDGTGARARRVLLRRFKPHAVRDGNLITGQQQYSGAEAARLMIEALGT